MFDTKLFCLQRERGGLGRKMESIGVEAVSTFFFSFSVKLLLFRKLAGAKEKGDEKGQITLWRKNLQC